MTDIKEYKDIDESLKKLVKALDSHLTAGVQNADAEEIGYVTDSIKDLAEAKEKCAKTCYYEKITEAMEESKRYPQEDAESPQEDARYYRGRNPWGSIPTGALRYQKCPQITVTMFITTETQATEAIAAA